MTSLPSAEMVGNFESSLPSTPAVDTLDKLHRWVQGEPFQSSEIKVRVVDADGSPVHVVYRFRSAPFAPPPG